MPDFCLQQLAAGNCRQRISPKQQFQQGDPEGVDVDAHIVAARLAKRKLRRHVGARSPVPVGHTEIGDFQAVVVGQ